MLAISYGDVLNFSLIDLRVLFVFVFFFVFAVVLLFCRRRRRHVAIVIAYLVMTFSWTNLLRGRPTKRVVCFYD